MLLNQFLLLFDNAGSELLIRELPSIFDGSARVKAQPQDHSKATLAPKVVLVLIMLLGSETETETIFLLILVQHISDPLFFFAQCHLLG